MALGLGLIATLFPPQPREVSFEETFQTEAERMEYIALANKVGFTNVLNAVDNRTEQLRNFLAENGICVYDEGRVNRYMNMITPWGKAWLWRPVGHNNHDPFTSHYSKPIPMAVLMTMEKIVDGVPSVLFQVTDFRDSKPRDPFLRVSADGQIWFIIERWDEPAFR